MSNILVLAPHADDEILGCGGTIAKHLKQQDNVYIAVLTNAAIGAPELFGQDTIENIRAEAREAHNKLGVTKSYFFDLPAPQLEQYPQYKIATVINKLIKETGATHLYIPHVGDLHMDHGAVYNAALVASRPLPGQTVKHVYAYETLSETEWGHPTPAAAFIPNKFVDISGDCFEQKIAAMSCFESQLGPFPYSRSLEAIEHQARLRGASVGVCEAEAFMVIRTID